MSLDERTKYVHGLKKVPRPGRHMKGKSPENSGISISDLLQRFPISISIENAGASTEENERQQHMP